MPTPRAGGLTTHQRARVMYVASALLSVVIGLEVHRGAMSMSPVARDVAGDALWATMMTWWISALMPALPLRIRGALALGVCWLVECSQLWHTPLLDAIRATTMGQLVLGSGFDARDLLAYAAGVGVAMLCEVPLLRSVRAGSGR